MAEPLKHFFSSARVRGLGERLALAEPSFPVASFVDDATRGLDGLELMARGRHVAAALDRALPADRTRALAVVVAAMGPPLATEGDWGMAPFELLPHSTWIATYALDVPDAAFDAMHALTKRFTAEFAMRPYLERWTELSFRRLERWVDDPDAHVRRAASEGTRLRLPWGARVAALTADPTRALRLITPLRDDPSSYVRRSVANHLNDIGKQDPALLLDTCRSWIVDAPEPRRDLLRHALRDRVKKGDRDAIALLGAGGGDVAVRAELPDRAALGDAIRVRVFVVNRGSSPTRAVVDLAVNFPGNRAEGRNKVFKVATVDLAPGVEVELRKSISLKDHTTRAARAGPHALEAQVDGRRVPLGVVEVR